MPAAFFRNREITASVRAQKIRGESMYPNGSLVAQIKRPVPGCRTTSLFLLSSAIGTCQKPSLMSYLAKHDVGVTHRRASHTDGNAKEADGTILFVPTE
tara:strand:- start:117 stop:413 length:297 start_codon:yes stop_codon:yes gene_type:complete